MLVKVITVALQIIAYAIWFYAGILVGKHKVYKEWSSWLDRMGDIQKRCKNEEDNHK